MCSSDLKIAQHLPAVDLLTIRDSGTRKEMDSRLERRNRIEYLLCFARPERLLGVGRGRRINKIRRIDFESVHSIIASQNLSQVCLRLLATLVLFCSD